MGLIIAGGLLAVIPSKGVPVDPDVYAVDSIPLVITSEEMVYVGIASILVTVFASLFALACGGSETGGWVARAKPIGVILLFLGVHQRYAIAACLSFSCFALDAVRCRREKMHVKSVKNLLPIITTLAYGHYFDATNKNVDASLQELLKSLAAKHNPEAHFTLV